MTIFNLPKSTPLFKWVFPSLIFLSFFIIACRTSDIETPSYSPPPDFEADAICFLESNGRRESSVVIRDIADLEPYSECNFNFNAIDFSTQTLVAIRLNLGGGCEFPTYKITDMKRDDLNQRLILYVEVTEVGNCLEGHGLIRWLAIAPLPENYEVVVEYEYR